MININCVNKDNTVITKRRHPNKITTCAKIAYKLFRDLTKKDLSCLALTYLYNIEINVVNKGDQR